MMSKFKKWLISQPKAILIIFAIPIVMIALDVVASLLSSSDDLGVISAFVLMAVFVYLGISIYKLFKK